MDQLPPEGSTPTPERPRGHIRVSVSQPELLYQLAQEVVPPLRRVILVLRSVELFYQMDYY